MEGFKEFFRRHLAFLIVMLILWILGELFIVAPISVCVAKGVADGHVTDQAVFIETFFQEFSSMKSISKVMRGEANGNFSSATLYWTIFFGIACGIGLYKGRKKGAYDKIEHGSSDWSNGEQYSVLSKDKGLILAEKNYLPTNKPGNVNVLIVGGSGSGKSSSYTIPNAHQLLGSYIFTDPKGEIYDKTAGYLKKNGYEIKLLNLVNPKSSDSYNPLAHIHSEIDVDVIASTVVKGQKKEGSSTQDPFWDNMSELLLKSLIYYLKAIRPEEEQNLASCAEMVRAANNNGATNVLAEEIHKLPYDHPAVMNFKSVELASDKTYSSILSSLQSALGKFDSPDIADVTSTNTIEFDDIAQKKTALYVVSSDTHTAYDFLLTIFFSQLIQQLYDYADKHGGKLSIPCYFILDEFANIGQIPDFDKKISTSRSRGISFSVILQNLDQLKAIYEKSYETIIGNCDTHVFLGSNSFATVEYFSKELGEKTISHESISANRDNLAARKGYSESEQIMARALMTPDELRRMSNDYCIIYEKGLKPIKAKKYWYFKKPSVLRDLTNNSIDHNDYILENRGNWRKFNPNNPYTPNANESEEDLNVGSLDELFSDDSSSSKDPIAPTDSQTNAKTTISSNMSSSANVNFDNNINNSPNTSTEMKIDPVTKVMPIHDNVETVSIPEPTIPLGEDSTLNSGVSQNKDTTDELDIQKELEAKFDELFGPIDDSD